MRGFFKFKLRGAIHGKEICSFRPELCKSRKRLVTPRCVVIRIINSNDESRYRQSSYTAKLGSEARLGLSRHTPGTITVRGSVYHYRVNSMRNKYVSRRYEAHPYMKLPSFPGFKNGMGDRNGNRCAIPLLRRSD